MYFYWITLSIVFIAGTTRVTIFSIGYLFGSFFFLWKGYSLFFKSMDIVIKLLFFYLILNFDK